MWADLLLKAAKVLAGRKGLRKVSSTTIRSRDSSKSLRGTQLVPTLKRAQTRFQTILFCIILLLLTFSTQASIPIDLRISLDGSEMIVGESFSFSASSYIDEVLIYSLKPTASISTPTGEVELEPTKNVNGEYGFSFQPTSAGLHTISVFTSDGEATHSANVTITAQSGFLSLEADDVLLAPGQPLAITGRIIMAEESTVDLSILNRDGRLHSLCSQTCFGLCRFNCTIQHPIALGEHNIHATTLVNNILLEAVSPFVLGVAKTEDEKVDVDIPSIGTVSESIDLHVHTKKKSSVSFVFEDHNNVTYIFAGKKTNETTYSATFIPPHEGRYHYSAFISTESSLLEEKGEIEILEVLSDQEIFQTKSGIANTSVQVINGLNDVLFFNPGVNPTIRTTVSTPFDGRIVAARLQLFSPSSGLFLLLPMEVHNQSASIVLNSSDLPLEEVLGEFFIELDSGENITLVRNWQVSPSPIFIPIQDITLSPNASINLSNHVLWNSELTFGAQASGLDISFAKDIMHIQATNAFSGEIPLQIWVSTANYNFTTNTFRISSAGNLSLPFNVPGHIQEPAKVGEPVKWKIRDVESATIPLDFFNLSVEKENGEVLNSSQANFVLDGENITFEDIVESKKVQDLIKRLEQREIEVQQSGVITRIIEYLSLRAENESVETRLNSIPLEKRGLIDSLEKGESLGLQISNDTAQVTYQTPAPELYVKNTTTDEVHWKEDFSIGANVSYHYYNVWASTEIPESHPKQIHLFWHTENESVDVIRDPRFTHLNVTLVDTNQNGQIDQIQWVTPHLSEQNFTSQVNLTLLNIQSYPTVQGNWTILFETIGTANLTITPIQSTTWTEFFQDRYYSDDDLDFSKLECGEDRTSSLIAVLDNGDEVAFTSLTAQDSERVQSLIYPNWSCDNQTALHENIVKTLGEHHIQFTFGNQSIVAKNLAAGAYAMRIYLYDTQGNANPADDILLENINATFGEMNGSNQFIGKFNTSVYNYSTYLVEVQVNPSLDYNLSAQNKFETVIMASNPFNTRDLLTQEYIVSTGVVADDGERIADIFVADEHNVDYSVDANVFETGYIAGDVDVMVGFDNIANEVRWYENTHNFSSDWENFSVGINENDAAALFAWDIDRDGRTDLVEGEYGNDINIADNNYKGTWAVSNLDANSGDNVISIAVGDLDNDGLVDVVGGTDNEGAQGVTVYQNDGTPFSGVWTEQLLWTGSHGTKVVLADLDNDDDLDVVACAFDERFIIAFENDYEADGDPFNGPWSTIFIANTTDQCNSLAAVDFEKDGYMDLVAATNNGSSSLFIMRNDFLEDGDVWDSNWTNYTIVETGEDIQDIALADIDLDDDLDIFAIHENGDDLYWHENSGDPFSEGWTANAIDTTTLTGFSMNARGSRRGEISTADINSDGLPDVVINSFTTTEQLSWFENREKGTSFTKHLIETAGPEQTYSNFLADFDDDNRSNVLDFTYNATENLESGISNDNFVGWNNLTAHENYSFYFIFSPDNEMEGSQYDNLTFFLGNASTSKHTLPYEKLFGSVTVPIKASFEWIVNQQFFYNISNVTLSATTGNLYDNITLDCLVTDNRTQEPISNWNVSFYNSTHAYMGSNFTNATGWAGWKYEFNSSGLHEIYCNISDNSSYWVFTDQSSGKANVTIAGAGPPTWSSPETVPNSPRIFSAYTTYYFNTTWQALNGIKDVLIEHNFTGTITNYSVTDSTGSEYSFPYIGIPVGEYYWKMHANDTVDQFNSTDAYGYTILPDTVAPTITLNSPQNGSVINSSGINFNFTVLENSEQFQTCNITTNFSRNVSQITTENGTDYIHHMENILPGNYQWGVQCWDTSGNYRTSVQNNFTVDFGRGHYFANIIIKDTQGDANPSNDIVVLMENSSYLVSNNSLVDLGNLNISRSLYNYSTYIVEITLGVGDNYTLDADRQLESFIMAEKRFGMIDQPNTSEYVITTANVNNDGTRVADIFVSTTSQVDYSVDASVHKMGYIRGDTDVIAGYDNIANEIRWYANPQHDPGLYPTFVNWTEYALIGDNNDAQTIVTADLDRDGDMDVLSGEVGQDIHVQENNLPGAWVEQDADTGATDQVLQIARGDLDNDGDIDILAGVDDDGAQSLGVYENDGTPFDVANWNNLVLNDTVITNGVALADLDNDGDLDAVACSLNGNGVFIYENDWDTDGNAFNTPWQATQIHSATFCVRVAVGDFDNDEHIDIVATYQDDANVVTLLRNDHVVDGDVWNGTWTNETIVYTAAENGHDVAVADMDGDNDLDIVALMDGGNDLYWFENDGTSFDGGWSANVITATFGSISFAGNGRTRGEIAVFDIDSDGDPDIYGSSVEAQGRVKWFENDLPATTWTLHEIQTNGPEQVFSIGIGDIDNDNNSNIIDFYWNETENLEYGINTEAFNGWDNLTRQNNYSLYFILSPDNNMTGDLQDNITLFLGNESQNSWSEPYERVFGAATYPIRLHFQWNVNRRIYYNISDANVTPLFGNLSINPLFNNTNFTAWCQVTDNSDGSPINNTNVTFFNGTGSYMGSMNTTESGWANHTFQVPTLGEHNVTCNLSVFEQPEIWRFSEVNNRTIFFNATDGVSPWFENWTMGITNNSNVTRFNWTYVQAQWWDNYFLNDSRREHNSSGAFVNYSQPLSGYADFANHTLNFSNQSEFVNFGPMEIRMHGVDQGGNVNVTNISFYLTLWRWANLTNLETSIGAQIVENDTFTINCSVFDPYNTTGIPGYAVTVQDNVTGFIGSNVTNASGNMSFQFQYPSIGHVNLTCEITDDLDDYYFAFDQLNLSHQFFVVGLSNLNISDETMEPENDPAEVFEQISFYANYTDSGLNFINTSSMMCNITFNLSDGWTTEVNMTFNASTELHEYNRSFNRTGTYDYNISCNSTEYLGALENNTISILSIGSDILRPTNGTELDRDSVSLTIEDNETIRSRLSRNQSGVNISIYMNLTIPGVPGQTLLFIGTNTTNATGHASFDWNPPSTTYAGNYTLYSNATFGGELVAQPRAITYAHILGGLNVTYVDNMSFPNVSYRQGDNVIIEANVTSLGIENQTELNETYNLTYNVSLLDPFSQVFNLTLEFNGSIWENRTFNLSPIAIPGLWNSTLNSSALYFITAIDELRNFTVNTTFANLSTFDDYDIGPGRANTCTQYTIYTNYSASTDGRVIPNGLCNVTFFNGSTEFMVYNPNNLLYELNTTFQISGQKIYNSSCDSPSFLPANGSNLTNVLNNVSIIAEKNVTSLSQDRYNISIRLENQRDCPVYNTTLYDFIPRTFTPEIYEFLPNGSNYTSGDFTGNSSFWRFDLLENQTFNLSYSVWGNDSMHSPLDLYILGIDPWVNGGGVS